MFVRIHVCTDRRVIDLLQIFKLISRAHATLSDAEQRRQYDASRARRRLQRAFTTGMSSMPGFGFSGFASHGRYSYGRF